MPPKATVKTLRVLIGCEESGTVRDAFLALGHDAWSNDVVTARNGGPHIQACVKDAIRYYGPWDIIILHPDCTEMTVAGNRWYGAGTPGYHKRLDAIAWTVDLWTLATSYARIGCALENPVSVIWEHIGKPQYVQPWMFGHKETKRTGILTHNLPPLKPTDIVGPPPPSGTQGRKAWEVCWRMAKSPTRKRDRSKTQEGLAKAMAEQYS